MRQKQRITWPRVGGALAVLVLGACIPLGHGRTFSRQTVVAKTADGYLVAAGGAKCRAATAALAAAEVGASVRCVWLTADNDAHMGRPTRPRFPRAVTPNDR